MAVTDQLLQVCRAAVAIALSVAIDLRASPELPLSVLGQLPNKEEQLALLGGVDAAIDEWSAGGLALQLLQERHAATLRNLVAGLEAGARLFILIDPAPDELARISSVVRIENLPAVVLTSDRNLASPLLPVIRLSSEAAGRQALRAAQSVAGLDVESAQPLPVYVFWNPARSHLPECLAGTATGVFAVRAEADARAALALVQSAGSKAVVVTNDPTTARETSGTTSCVLISPIHRSMEFAYPTGEEAGLSLQVYLDFEEAGALAVDHAVRQWKRYRDGAEPIPAVETIGVAVMPLQQALRNALSP